jgi:hypothetical protein
MRQTVSPTLGTLARMNVLLFALLCLFVSCIGTAFGLALGIFSIAILLLVTDFNDDNIDGVIVLTFAVIGFSIPLIALVKGRSRQFRKAFKLHVDRSNNESSLNMVGYSRVQDTIPSNSNTSSAPPSSEKIQGPSESNAALDVSFSGASNLVEPDHILETQAARRQIRIIDWGFLFYNLLYIPILLLLLLADAFRNSGATDLRPLAMIVAIPALFTAFLELRGVSIKATKLAYPVRIQIYGPFAFPLFRRTIDLEGATEATADTQYQNVRFRELSKLRIVYISGDFMQARIWFSSKGRRDWLFSQLRAAAPHIRQYRGRW